jgi:hypothetical protein
MGEFLTTASVMMCPHGGQVQPASANSRVSADSAPMLRSSDTFVIAGCPFNVAGAPHPCVTVQWVTAALRSTVGDPTLTTDSLGLCQAADQAVQGQVQIASTQASVSGE